MDKLQGGLGTETEVIVDATPAEMGRTGICGFDFSKLLVRGLRLLGSSLPTINIQMAEVYLFRVRIVPYGAIIIEHQLHGVNMPNRTIAEYKIQFSQGGFFLQAQGLKFL